jgi:hypothetical protein
MSILEYDEIIFRLYTHLDKVADVLFPSLKQTGDIGGVYIDDPRASEVCALLVRAGFKSTEIDEPAAGNRIRHQVLGYESGMDNT